jgi:hypothetical protein
MLMGFLRRFNPWRAVRTTHRREKMLDDARSELLDCVKSKEYYDAIVPMLRKRIDRLEREIARKARV